MIDKIIATGATFDWLTPLWTFVQDWQNRPSVGFNLPTTCGMSALGIQDLLRSKGVKVWGLTIFDNIITFRVRKTQKHYVRYLLETAGVLLPVEPTGQSSIDDWLMFLPKQSGIDYGVILLMLLCLAIVVVLWLLPA